MCCLLSTENMVHQHHTVIAQNITALYVKLVEKRMARPSLHTPTADNGLVCWNVMPAVYDYLRICSKGAAPLLKPSFPAVPGKTADHVP